MTIASELERIITAKEAIKQAIASKGVTVPTGTLVSDYHTYIDQIIPKTPDPDNPTFENLKLALKTNDPASYYPVGTEIPDTYAGTNNPCIVAQYYDGNGVYGDRAGVFLVRKYVYPTSQVFGSSSDYGASTMKTFLNSTYLNNCSTELQSVITEINIPTGSNSVASKFFPMSSAEVGGTDNSGYGIFWDLWKQRTGWTAPSNSSNSGRVVNDISGGNAFAWLRSSPSTGYVKYIASSGSIGTGTPNTASGVLPAFFIGKD